MTRADDLAFPRITRLDATGSGNSCNYETNASPGLSKREYFAAMAMVGYLANPALRDVTVNNVLSFADALIAELNRTRSPNNEA